MSIEEIISRLEFVACAIDGKKGAKVLCGALDAKALRSAVALLRTHPDAQPNEPLTLEELRSMLDCPVWMVGDDEITETGWCLVHRCTNDAVEVIVPSGLIYRVISENIGEVCKFYRRSPKEETH